MTRSQRATRSQGTLATTDTAKVTTEAATKPKKSKGWVYVRKIFCFQHHLRGSWR